MKTFLKIVAAVVFLYAAFSLSRCSEPSDRHYVDGGSPSYPWIFASRDMSPITVNFQSGIPPSVVTQIALPRAFVISVSGYATTSLSPEYQVQKLPQTVHANGPLTLLYLHPSGLPYTRLEEQKIDQTAGPDDGSLGHDFATRRIGDKRRWLQVTADIFLLHARQIAEGTRTAREFFDCADLNTCVRRYRWGNHIGSYEGFAEYELPGSLHMFVDDSSDEIREIQCSGNVEQSRAGFFCRYRFALNERLFAELQFIDFRHHGGREFARKRIQAFKQKFCSYLHCDDRALAAAGLK